MALRLPRALSAVLAVGVAVLLGLPAAPAAAAVPPAPGPDIVLNGGGWGHSVGMSQYGAYAMALSGHSAEAILEHYYPGVEVGGTAADDAAEVAVDLFWNKAVPRSAPAEPLASRVELRRDSRGAGTDEPLIVRMGALGSHRDHWLGAGQTWGVFAEAGRYVLRTIEADNRGGAVIDSATEPPRVFVYSPATSSALIGLPQTASSYRWGTLTITFDSTSTRNVWQPVLRQQMREYLRGIAEMPSNWALEALKAQAITARTYALRQGGVISATPAHQNYAGWEKESFGGTWLRAVDESAGQKVTYRGALATTYYSSSHGLGRTENSGDSWAFSQTLPYLTSVADPWSSDPRVRNPFASWTATATNPELAGLIGLARINNIRIISRTAGNSPKALEIHGWTTAGDRVTCVWSGGSACTANDATAKGAGAAMRTSLPLLSGGAANNRLRSQQISSITIAPFNDDEGSLHQFNIGVLAAVGVTGGCAAGAYCPASDVTRGEMATFLGRAIGLVPETGGPVEFPDAEGTRHEGFINALKRAGKISGYPDGTFRPALPVTRAQMATYIARAFDIPGSETARYDDIAGTDPHRVFINAIAERNITSGCAPGRYCPGSNVTREQMATYLARALGLGA